MADIAGFFFRENRAFLGSFRRAGEI